MKKIIFLLAGILVIVGIFVYKLIFSLPIKNLNLSKAVPEATPTVTLAPISQIPSINFSQTGNLVNFDSATQKETAYWSLLYEQPGSSGLKVKLVFDEGSFCNDKPCNEVELSNGERVKVEGIIAGEIVKVVNLNKIIAD